MPAAFTRAQIEAVAALALLELTDSEMDTLARQLGDILDYATRVQQIDTAGVPPTSSVSAQHDGDRDDRLAPSLDRREALANAPDASIETGLFKVPRVIG